MREIILIYKKEAKDFSVRTFMLGRYALLLLLNAIVAIYPTQSWAATLTSSKPHLSFCFMLFTMFAVLGFLSVDVIGSEKTKKTYETLLSAPLKLSNIFLGMTAFMATIGIMFIGLATVYNSLWLSIFFHQSFSVVLASPAQWLIAYVLIVLSIFLMVLIGLIVNLFARNQKVGRLLMLAVGIAMIYGIYQFILNYTAELSLIVIVAMIAVLGLVFSSIHKHLNKQYALKFAR